MNLLPGERVLIETSSKSLVLTTHRIRFQKGNSSDLQIQSIMLEELASCSLVRKSQPGFLIIAILCLLIGLFVGVTTRRDNEIIFVISLVIAIIFILVYYASQEQIIEFASSGTIIKFKTKGMSLDSARNLIEQAEKAKNARYFFSDEFEKNR